MAKIKDRAKAVAYQIYLKKDPHSGRGLFDYITDFLENAKVSKDLTDPFREDLRQLRSLSIDDCAKLFKTFKGNNYKPTELEEKRERKEKKYITNDSQVVAFLRTCSIKPNGFRVETSPGNDKTVFFEYEYEKETLGLVRMFEQYLTKVEPRRFIKEYKYAVWESKQILKHPDWVLHGE